jgi:uncharacterized membrane protein
MMSDTTPAPRRGRSILLIVSLSLNVLLVAAIVVGVARAIHRHRDPMNAGGMLSPYAVLHEASKEERPKIQAVIDRHRVKVTALRDAAVTARIDAFETFAAPDFTPQRLEASLDKVREADAAVGKEVAATIVESVSLLTPAERKALEDRARRRASWFTHKLDKKK